jgi:hypothetical protein
MKIFTVGNIVHKNGRQRKHRQSQTVTVSLQEAPIEAWQQAILPHLEAVANGFGTVGVLKRALIIACLLRLKEYGRLPEFIEWCCQVTRYNDSEVAIFMERGIRGHIIVDEQPSDEVFRPIGVDQEGDDIILVLIAGVSEGTFERTSDDQYSLARDPTVMETTRWQDAGGKLLEAA